MASLNDKLSRVDSNVEEMRQAFGYSAATAIEVVTARAIAGPQAEECMRIYDLFTCISAKIIFINDNNSVVYPRSCCAVITALRLGKVYCQDISAHSHICNIKGVCTATSVEFYNNQSFSIKRTNTVTNSCQSFCVAIVLEMFYLIEDVSIRIEMIVVAVSHTM